MSIKYVILRNREFFLSIWFSLGPCYETDSEIPVCKNNGTCRIINSVRICDCAEGYAGQNCTRELKSKDVLLRFFQIKYECISGPLCKQVPGVCGGVGTCQQSLTPPYYSCNCGLYPSTFGKNISELVKCEESKMNFFLWKDISMNTFIK